MFSTAPTPRVIHQMDTIASRVKPTVSLRCNLCIDNRDFLYDRPRNHYALPISRDHHSSFHFPMNPQAMNTAINMENGRSRYSNDHTTNSGTLLRSWPSCDWDVKEKHMPDAKSDIHPPQALIADLPHSTKQKSSWIFLTHLRSRS